MYYKGGWWTFQLFDRFNYNSKMTLPPFPPFSHEENKNDYHLWFRPHITHSFVNIFPNDFPIFFALAKIFLVIIFLHLGIKWNIT